MYPITLKPDGIIAIGSIRSICRISGHKKVTFETKIQYQIYFGYFTAKQQLVIEPNVLVSLRGTPTWRPLKKLYKGYRMAPFNLKVLEKFSLCSNCSQKLDEGSFSRAHKIFATARILVKMCSIRSISGLIQDCKIGKHLKSIHVL